MAAQIPELTIIILMLQQMMDLATLVMMDNGMEMKKERIVVDQNVSLAMYVTLQQI